MSEEQVYSARHWAAKAAASAQDAAQSAQNSRGLAIGQLVWSQSSLAKDNPGCLPAWTGEYIANAGALYPDFYAWVKSHPELCKTKAQYDEALSAYGECPYYVADEVSGSLRLPKLANYIKNADGENGITQSKAGLPNVKAISNTAAPNVSGVASLPPYAKGVQNTQGYSLMTGQSISASTSLAYVENDASLDSAVYGASDTVTPAHTTLYPWIVAYTAAIPASVAQAAEFTGALSGKANADLSNVPVGYDYVIEYLVNSDGSWYRKYKSGWLEQGGKSTTVAGGATTTITLLKPYETTSYNVFVQPAGAYAPQGEANNTIPAQTTTTFTIACGQAAAQPFYWETKGQGAN